MEDLSMIITVHNGERHLLSLLSSILQQEIDKKYKVQYVFVFDDCTDKSHLLVDTMLKFYGMDVWGIDVHYNNTNMARNAGIKLATGEFTWVVDSDDWLIGNDSINSVINFCKQQNEFIVKVAFDTKGLPWFTTDELKSVYSYPWQYIFKTEFLKGFKFDTHNKIDSDSRSMLKLFEKHDKERLNSDIPFLSKNVYYYNFCRCGSKTYYQAISCGYPVT